MTIETADLSDSDEEIFNDFETYKKEHSFAKLSIPTLSAGSSERIAPVKSERSFSFAQETNLSSDEDQSLSAIDNSAEASKKTKRKRDEELTQLVDFSYKNTKAGCSTNSGRKVDSDAFDIVLDEGNVPSFVDDHNVFVIATMPASESTPLRCMIHVKNQMHEGKDKLLHWDMNKSLGELVKEYAHRLNLLIDPDKVIIMNKRSDRYRNEDTPNSLGFKKDITEVFLFETSTSEPPMMVTIKWQMNERKSFAYKVNKKSKFSVIKTKFCLDNKIFLKANQQIRFTFDSQYISDDKTPEELEIEDDDCIDVVLTT